MRRIGPGGAILTAVFLLLVFVVPVILVVLGALSARWVYPEIVPRTFSMRGFSFLVRNAVPVGRALGSSLLFSMLTVVGTVVLCVLPAGVLAREEFRGRLLLEALLLSPVVVPSVTWGLGLHFAMIRFGLANRMPGVVVVLIAASYPYMLRALISGYQNINPDLEVCAANLGAGFFTRLVRVHLPLLAPAIIAGGTVVFLVAFSEYFLVFLIGGGAVPSLTGYLFPYLSAGDRTIGSTLTLLYVVIPLFLFVLLDATVHRYYRKRGIL